MIIIPIISFALATIIFCIITAPTPEEIILRNTGDELPLTLKDYQV